MENNKETLTDIDKAKELFEYEMTEILLNLHGKFDNVGKDITSEYLNMEIEEPKLEYAAPEITLTGISYEQQSSGKLEKVDLKADAVKIELPELPSAEPVAVKAIDKADVDMQAVKAELSGTAADASKFSAKGLIAGLEKASQPRVISVDVNVSAAGKLSRSERGRHRKDNGTAPLLLPCKGDKHRDARGRRRQRQIYSRGARQARDKDIVLPDALGGFCVQVHL